MDSGFLKRIKRTILGFKIHYIVYIKKIFFLYGLGLLVLSCDTLNISPNSNLFENKSIEDLKAFIGGNCRFSEFSIGKYADKEGLEKFGLDTINSKYIWYSNSDQKIIVNTFLKEKFAVKYAYNQINRIFPKSKGAVTLTVCSKEIEEKLIADFKKKNIKFDLVVSFDDALGHTAKIDLSECDSLKAESVLGKYPEVIVEYIK